MMLLRSMSVEDVDCSSALPCPMSLVADAFEPDLESASTAKDLVEHRMRAACPTVYTLSFVQFTNLLFIYCWLYFSAPHSKFVPFAEVLLLITPLSGILGAYLKNIVWLEVYYMNSLLLFCSPLFFALTMFHSENLSLLGCAFFTYQMMLPFYQYKALKIVLQLQRDLKVHRLMQHPVIAA